MEQPAPILSVHHGELPAHALAAAPVHAHVTAEQAYDLVGPVNAALALHAPIVEFEDADNGRNPDVCAHCGEPIDDTHFRDKWYGNLLCPRSPTLQCDHCSNGVGGRADWPCATVKALTATA